MTTSKNLCNPYRDSLRNIEAVNSTLAAEDFARDLRVNDYFRRDLWDTLPILLREIITAELTEKHMTVYRYPSNPWHYDCCRVERAKTVVGYISILRPCERRDQSFETAAWWQDHTLQPGTYPITVDRNKSGVDRCSATIPTVKGKSYFGTLLCGNAVGSYDADQYVGEAGTYHMSWYGYSLAMAKLDGKLDTEDYIIELDEKWHANRWYAMRLCDYGPRWMPHGRLDRHPCQWTDASYRAQALSEMRRARQSIESSLRYEKKGWRWPSSRETMRRDFDRAREALRAKRKEVAGAA